MLTYAVVISLLVVGLWDMYKKRVIRNGSFLPMLFIFLAILTPILIQLLPNILGDFYTGYIRATVVLLYIMGLILSVLTIFIYLIYSKGKLIKGTDDLKTNTEIKKGIPDLGLKLGAIIIIAGALSLIILNFLGFNRIFFLDESLNESFIFLSNIIGLLIMIGSICSLCLNKYEAFGTIICVVGSVSRIAFLLYILVSGFFYIWGIYPMIIILGTLPIVGVILHHYKINAGGIICVSMGFISLLLNTNFGGWNEGVGFLLIYDSINLEPLLIMIGGYFLYQKQVRTRI